MSAPRKLVDPDPNPNLVASPHRRLRDAIRARIQRDRARRGQPFIPIRRGRTA